MYLPNIIEKTGRNTKLIDIPSKLYEDGIVTLFGPVDEHSSYSVVTQLLYLDTLEDEEPIKLYINSPGGSIYAGLAIHDTIKNMTRKVDTVAFGMAASMGAFLLSSGTGTRSAMPNTRIMIHSASSGMEGTVHDMMIDLEETKLLNNQLMQYMADYSNGKVTYEEVFELTKRDKYLSADESVELGLIDKVIK